MYHPYNELADNSRIWIYQADGELKPDELNFLSNELKNFISEWTAHNKDLSGSYQILHNRFLIIMIDENNTSASGCSIDKCFNFLKKMEQTLNIGFMNRMLLAYKENGEIKTIHKNKFEELIKEGKLNADTIVFNNLIEKKSELNSKWEVPVRESWHRVMLS